MLNEAVSLGSLARPGVGESIDVSVPAPPWLSGLAPGERPPCWDQDPELFFPYRYNLAYEDQIERARRVCASGCPVAARCLENAVANPDLDGIWAGTTPMERRRIRTGRSPRPPWSGAA